MGIGSREALSYIAVRTNQSYNLLLSVWCAVHSKSHANSARFTHTWYAGSHLSHPAFDGSSKLKGLHSSRSNPDVGVAGIYKSRRCAQKASQETPLKDHQEHRKRHAEHGYRKAGSIMNDILPSKFHSS